MKKLRILVACEYSGIVRDAFSKEGHDAWSCDILSTENIGNHYQDDIFNILYNHNIKQWDLMIAHPPCTYLTVSANKWYKDQPKRKSGTLVGKERREARKEAIKFFMALYNSGIPKIAVENPIGIMSTEFRKPDQIIQPWQFGHGETKATCLWLKNLPVLKPTKIVAGREQRIHRMAPGPDRQKERSRFYTGIAKAMAKQWN